MSRKDIQLWIWLSTVTNVSPEMALRLSKGLGRSPESWLAMQDSYNLWHVKQTVNFDEIEPLAITV